MHRLALIATMVSCAQASAPPLRLFVSPGSATLAPGETRQFAATDADGAPLAVGWSADGGAVDARGVFTAGGPGTFHIRATLSGDLAGAAEALVEVVAGPSSPRIVRFTAEPARILRGSSTVLSWDVEAAASLRVDSEPGPGPGAVDGPVRVSPAETTSYVLTAESDGGTDSVSVTVLVEPAGPPAIRSFRATPAAITAGGTARLSWEADGALAIDHGIGAVSGDSLDVSPATSTTYILTTIGPGGSAAAAATVTVGEVPPAIASFTADPPAIGPGESSTLAWSVEGAQLLRIDADAGPAVGEVTGASVDVSPPGSVTYTLTAANAAGEATRTVRVLVGAKPALPGIASFVAAPASIAPGGTATLSWDVSLADEVTIAPLGAQAGRTVDVSPLSTTTYVLTATNGAGSVSSARTVGVGPPASAPPHIARFELSPALARAGDPIQLRWSVDGDAAISTDAAAGAAVTATQSATIILSAANAKGLAQAAASLTVGPAVAPPRILLFEPDASSVLAGSATRLRWVVEGADAVQVSPAPGASQGSSAQVAPGSPTTYTLTATGAGGVATARAHLDVLQGPLAAPPAPGAADVTFTLDSSRRARRISPYVYGWNGADAPRSATFVRLGGNRWTTWNWVTNASNAGTDFGFRNDGYLSASTSPAAAVLDNVARARGALVTVPLQGWVAADESGPVNPAGPVAARFLPSLPRKSVAPPGPGDPGDAFIYQDELAQLVRRAARPLFFALDNEPDLWTQIHPEVQRAPLAWRDLAARSIALAAALKDAAPDALVFGPVSYGWNGFVTLQNAPDADPSKWFLQFYLEQMKAAGDVLGRRVLDALDVHWYPEIVANGVPITLADSSDASRAARVQAPRSLWDASFVEDSWITRDVLSYTADKAVHILPRLQSLVDAAYPGTRLVLSEYCYGGESDISGAVAEADALGVFGREGVFAAAFFPLARTSPAVRAGFAAFRDYDGAGAAFGDTGFFAESSDVARASVYASRDEGHPERIVAVLVNRSTAALATQLLLSHTLPLHRARAFQLDAAHLSPLALAPADPLHLTLPALSVTTLELTP